MNTINSAPADLLPLPTSSGRGSLKELASLDGNPPQQFRDLLERDSGSLQVPAVRASSGRISKTSASSVGGTARSLQSDAPPANVGGTTSDSAFSDSVGVESSGLGGDPTRTEQTRDSQPVERRSPEDLSADDAALDAAAFAAAAQFVQAAAENEISAPLVCDGSLEGSAESMNPEALRLFQASGRVGVAADSNRSLQGINPSGNSAAAAAVVGSSEAGVVASQVVLVDSGKGSSFGDSSEEGSAGNRSVDSDAKSSGTASRSGSQSAVRALSSKSTEGSKAAARVLEQNLVVGAVAGRSNLGASEQDIQKALAAPVVLSGATLERANEGGPGAGLASAETSVPASSGFVEGKASGESSQGSTDQKSGSDAHASGSGLSPKEGEGNLGQDVRVTSRGSVGVRGLGSGRSGSAGEPSLSSAVRDSASRGRSENRGAGSSLSVSPEGSELPSSATAEGSIDALQQAEPTAVAPGMQSRGGAEFVAQKTVVEPTKEVHSNLEVWRTISDAVERVRSENPSHLAMELRLRDGSSIGVELRMGAAGIEASFKSESQGLLKALESQWTAFLERQPTDLKVSSTIFEGRMGLNLSSGGGGDAAERREAFEDSASAASLAIRPDFTDLELPSEESLAPIPSRSSSGLLNLYA